MYQETYQLDTSESRIYLGRRLPQISIEFAEPDEIRSRKIVRRSNARISGKFPGWKTGRALQWESPHESNAMHLLDACPAVIAFSEQPCEIAYEIDGKRCRHYPDLLVETKTVKELWEVKTREQASDPEVLKRTEFMTAYLPAYGYGYRMMYAEDLAFKPRLRNVKRLLNLGAKIRLTDRQHEYVRRMFFEFKTLPWGALQFDQEHPNFRYYICRLILDGVLTFDIDTEISETTAIRWVFNQEREGEQSWASLISRKV